MNSVSSILTVIQTGAAVVLLTVGCASTPSSTEENAERRNAARHHEKALKFYQDGRYAEAAKLWETMYEDTLFAQDPSQIARAAYHLGLAAWKQQQYETAYRRFLETEQVQKKMGEIRPELTLMLAQADWLANQRVTRLRDMVSQFENNQKIPADLRVQALLIQVSDAPEISSPPESLESSLRRAEGLYPKLQSPALKRHLKHVLAVEAIRSGQWVEAAAFLAEALEQARRVGGREWMALHTYELGRIYEKLKEPERFAEQALRSAEMWQSLGKPTAARLVLQNAREAIRASEDSTLQELVSALETALAEGGESAGLRGDLDSILLSVLNAGP